MLKRNRLRRRKYKFCFRENKYIIALRYALNVWKYMTNCKIILTLNIYANHYSFKKIYLFISGIYIVMVCYKCLRGSRFHHQKKVFIKKKLSLLSFFFVTLLPRMSFAQGSIAGLVVFVGIGIGLGTIAGIV